MAVYDRRFLVPYLRDACCLELYCQKIEREIAACRSNIQSLSNAINTKTNIPSRPVASNYLEGRNSNMGGVIVGVIIIIISLFIKVKLLDWLGIGVIAYVGVAFGALVIFAGVGEVLDERSRGTASYKNDLAIYEQAVEKARAKERQIPKQKALLSNYQTSLVALQNNLNSGRQMKMKLYAANIIPRPYRNLHAVYYLYDFFSSGRETDLEKVINTFVLEEIKQRLDRLIMQNEEILLNQRVQMAMQEQQNKVIAENNRRQMEQFAKMERNQELQTEYQKMISINQEVTNFFLAADYYRKYH